ncbi:hypothetical protein ACQR3P_30545 [Rhodococcus sp. IEGM1300]
MSKPTITYLGPAGGSDMGDGTMSKHCNEAVEGDDGGLVICRGCKARGTYTELPAGECPTPYKSDRALLAESIAREQALQLRLNVADQRIDELTQHEREPVNWAAPKTVRQLIRQLQTLDPDLETHAMLRIPDFKDGKQVRSCPLSISYERMEGPWLSSFKGEGRKVIAIWAKTTATCRTKVKR